MDILSLSMNLNLKKRKVSPHYTLFETFTLIAGRTTKRCNNNLAPPPHTGYEPLNTLLWYTIAFHSSTIIRREILQSGGVGDWYEQLSPAGPITLQWGFRSGLHAGQSINCYS